MHELALFFGHVLLVDFGNAVHAVDFGNAVHARHRAQPWKLRWMPARKFISALAQCLEHRLDLEQMASRAEVDQPPVWKRHYQRHADA